MRHDIQRDRAKWRETYKGHATSSRSKAKRYRREAARCREKGDMENSNFYEEEAVFYDERTEFWEGMARSLEGDLALVRKVAPLMADVAKRAIIGATNEVNPRNNELSDKAIGWIKTATEGAIVSHLHDIGDSHSTLWAEATEITGRLDEDSIRVIGAQPRYKGEDS